MVTSGLSPTTPDTGENKMQRNKNISCIPNYKCSLKSTLVYRLALQLGQMVLTFIVDNHSEPENIDNSAYVISYQSNVCRSVCLFTHPSVTNYLHFQAIWTFQAYASRFLYDCPDSITTLAYISLPLPNAHLQKIVSV